jgi:hypothetical protein
MHTYKCPNCNGRKGFDGGGCIDTCDRCGGKGVVSDETTKLCSECGGAGGFDGGGCWDRCDACGGTGRE